MNNFLQLDLHMESLHFYFLYSSSNICLFTITAWDGVILCFETNGGILKEFLISSLYFAVSRTYKLNKLITFCSTIFASFVLFCKHLIFSNLFLDGESSNLSIIEVDEADFVLSIVAFNSDIVAILWNEII